MLVQVTLGSHRLCSIFEKGRGVGPPHGTREGRKPTDVGMQDMPHFTGKFFFKRVPVTLGCEDSDPKCCEERADPPEKQDPRMGSSVAAQQGNIADPSSSITLSMGTMAVQLLKCLGALCSYYYKK